MKYIIKLWANELRSADMYWSESFWSADINKASRMNNADAYAFMDYLGWDNDATILEDDTMAMNDQTPKISDFEFEQAHVLRMALYSRINTINDMLRMDSEHLPSDWTIDLTRQLEIIKKLLAT